MILNKHLSKKKGEPQQYDVEKIVAERRDGNRMLYLVKWLGYSHEENTWEPRAHLKNAPEKIREWNRIKKKKNNRLSASQLTQPEPTDASPKNIKKYTQKQSKAVRKHTEISYKDNFSITDKELLSIPSQIKAEAYPQNEQKEERTFNPNVGRSLRSRKLLLLKETTQRQIQLSGSTQSEHCSKIQKTLCVYNPQKQQSREDLVKKQNSMRPSLDQNVQSFPKKQGLHNDYEDIFIVEESISESLPPFTYNSLKKYEDNFQIYFQMEKTEKNSNQFLQNKEATQQLQKSLTIHRSNMVGLNLQEKDERFVIECFEDENFDQEIQPVETLPKLRSSHNHFFQDSPQQGSILVSEPQYSILAQITKMFKEQGIVYCSVMTKVGEQIDKLPYLTIEALRPDLVCSFFNNKYVCKRISA